MRRITFGTPTGELVRGAEEPRKLKPSHTELALRPGKVGLARKIPKTTDHFTRIRIKHLSPGE